MKVTLDKEAIRIAHAAASPKDNRPVLQCVCIGNGEIVAADGYMLARRPISTDPDKGETILVNAKALLAAYRILKGSDLVIESQEDGKTATIVRDHEKERDLTISISTKLLEAKYPAYYTRILPKTKRKAYVSLQAHLVAKLLKTTSQDSGIAIKLKVREPTDPVEVHIHETDICIMPYFTPEE